MAEEEKSRPTVSPAAQDVSDPSTGGGGGDVEMTSSSSLRARAAPSTTEGNRRSTLGAAREENRAFRRVATSTNDDINATRAQAVHIRHDSETGAMGKWPRFRRKLAKLWRRYCLCQKKKGQDGGDQDGDDDDVEEGGGKRVQYRIEAKQETSGNILYRLLQFCCVGAGRMGNNSTVGLANPNQLLAMYLHWMFRVNFIFLFALSCAFFFMFTIAFAGFITIAGNLDPDCVRIGGEPFGSAGAPFADAFALSWTTFSTVGYGSTYPALSYEHANSNNCTFITFLCSLESFLGVLYSGFCGAILFGKVLRIQSHAQVIFSDPIVIRYGSGVDSYDEEADDEDEVEHEDEGLKEDDDETPKVKIQKQQRKIPCPVLEFRIVNRLFNEIGGEIMDATLNVCANVDADDADPALRDALDPDRRQWAASQRLESEDVETVSESSFSGSEMSGTDATTERSATASAGGGVKSPKASKSKHNLGLVPGVHHSVRGISKGFLDQINLIGGRDHRAVDEDPSSKLVSKRIFSKLLIEASDHPFFKRVWLARHILDETSPILTPKARRLVRKNGGHWPQSMNTHQGVRNSLRFNQILVSLNGVSNVSASDVYAQKIYDFVDVNIGYQFVNILYRDDNGEGALKVDQDLINDVREQNGGGGEPLIV